MQIQLQESRAANGVLNVAQAAGSHGQHRQREVAEKRNVVIRRVEIRVIEEVERVGAEAQPVLFFRQERLADGQVNTLLKRPAEYIAPGAAKKRTRKYRPQERRSVAKIRQIVIFITDNRFVVT